MDCHLGVDVGSVSTNLALIDDGGNVLETLYIRTQGQPIKAVQEGLRRLKEVVPESVRIRSAGATGSARNLTGIIIGADLVKNEITAHAIAAMHIIPEVRTVFEIGGQDSKIIIIRDGIVVDFAMNSVCAAGTGSFLDHQAERLGIPIEEFGELALKATNPVRIAGRCSVFAESDMIHKQQVGCAIPDIIAGLCEALVRNYLNNVGKGKDILEPIIFQGGVAANRGIKWAFEKALDTDVVVPPNFNVMGAIGAALLSKEKVGKSGVTKFKGFQASDFDYKTTTFECKGCSNLCEVVEIKQDGRTLARWGDRCGKWQAQAS